MSKGNPRVILRLTPKVIAHIEHAIDCANERRKEAPYDLSSWIRHAIKEKLEKLARGRMDTSYTVPTELG